MTNEQRILQNRLIAYLFRYNEEMLLVTSANWKTDLNTVYYDSFRIYIGPENSPMSQVEVSRTDRYRDGGTTILYTTNPFDEPRLFVPSPWKTHLKPTWKGNPITKLSKEDYTITEYDDGTAIVSK